MRRHTAATLVRTPEAARQARRIVSATCTDWRITTLEPDAEIVASELVENTLQHTDSPPRLRLVLHDGALTVAVSDSGAGPPAGEHWRGLGMRLVAGVAEAWGCTTARAGKTVWAVLSTRR
ncbi:MAG TPA: ATP-binding protein [Amycolatopsis sp.]|uniref:ATP-binding protein n=1 Tax=Amycolatopsis sp. TaxID=37632 RepID=UPI002B47A682|nr:ATP-binding protein [Amycolatopsis sp.]HKS47909.1 ATP-binding protein [Amycolatopsis sp.]